jgi:RNA polymerase sigma factor (TIGR02999 family)
VPGLSDPNPQQLTRLLIGWSDGNKEALDELMPLVYDELRRLAAAYLRRERPDHTLQSGALVSEAYLRLIDQSRVRWKNRAHFFGVAAQMMRRILVDHARNRVAMKRGAGATLISINDAIVGKDMQNLDLIALDDALTKLAGFDEQQSKIVELRFFGELSIEETAEVLGISPATVKRDWAVAKAWLFRQMSSLSA